MHRYYSPMRPVFIGTYPQPEGNKVVDIFNFDHRERIDGFPRPIWGWIDYEKPLSDKDMLDYELFYAENFKEEQ